MEEHLEIIGPESQVLCYNLNRQFCNMKKLVITGDMILSSFEEKTIKDYFEKAKGLHPNQFLELQQSAKAENLFDATLNNELYKVIQEKIMSLTETGMDIQLKDYNFMNSMSNTKFTITIRSEQFSISKYYQEKGTIIAGIRSLVEQYALQPFNAFRLSRLENFQIEIYESEEIHKHIFLKKEGKSLILASSFGFSYVEPMDYNIGPEIYFSKNEAFQLFKNSQQRAYIRDHTKIVDAEIQTTDKILSDENLVLLNNTTKDINDAVIEMYLTKKGNLKIVNLAILENSIIGDAHENGFILNKSSKNYDKVSLLGLRDSLDEESTNPKYLVVRNFTEVKELLEDLTVLNKVDGVIFTDNFYHPIIDYVSKSLDIDVVFYKLPLEKALEVKFDLNSFQIGSSESVVTSANPFSNIIEDNNKEKDEYLERLKNIDLSTPSTEPDPMGQPVRDKPSQFDDVAGIQNIAQQIISSPNSSVNQTSTSSYVPSTGPSGEKRSAMSFLADAAMKGPEPEPLPPAPTPQPEPAPQVQPVQDHTPNEILSQMEASTDLHNSSLVMNDASADEVKPIFEDFASPEPMPSASPTPEPSMPISEPSALDFGAPTVESEINSTTEEQVGMGGAMPSANSSLKIITNPGVSSGNYFVDSTTLSQVQGGEIYFMSSTKENLSNPNINYILPISLADDSVMQHFLLINSANDFFMIDINKPHKYFVNLSHVEASVRGNFLEKCLDIAGKCHVIILKSDLDSIKSYLDRIEGIYIKDVSTEEELSEVKSQLGVN